MGSGVWSFSRFRGSGVWIFRVQAFLVQEFRGVGV